MFLQEIQDNSGPKDDGTVDANVTLSTLVNAITKISNVTYSFVEVIPVDGQDGGQPGGNIRQAYLWVERTYLAAFLLLAIAHQSHTRPVFLDTALSD